MSENQDIGDLLGKIEAITCQLKDLDKAFDESVIMSKIICNLPAEYDNLITAWNNMPEGQQKLDNLILQLLKEETKLKRHKEQDQSIAAKAVATKATIWPPFLGWQTQPNNCGKLLASPSETSGSQLQQNASSAGTSGS